MSKTASNVTIVAVIVVFLAVGCSQEPSEIYYGNDECAHCKMMISDSRFAAQIVTEKGKAIKFDAIECMAAYKNENRQDLKNAKLWISSFIQPEQWLPVEEAYIVKSQVIKSPMGKSLLALPSAGETKEHLKEYPGKEIDWNDLNDRSSNNKY